MYDDGIQESLPQLLAQYSSFGLRPKYTGTTFAFEDNVADGDGNLIDSDGFSQVNATFVNSSDRGLLTNGAGGTAGIVTLPITTVAGKKYQVKFDVIAVSSTEVNVSLGTSAAYNSSNKITSSGAATNLLLDNAYEANDTTSFLALQLTTTTNGHQRIFGQTCISSHLVTCRKPPNKCSSCHPSCC